MECGRDSWICDVLKTQIYGPLIPMTHGASIMLWDSLACVAELKVIVFFIFYVSSVLYSELFHGSVNSIFFDSFYGTLRTLLLNISEAYLHQSIMNIKSAHMAGKMLLNKWKHEIKHCQRHYGPRR